MPIRQLPRTNEQRHSALYAIKDILDGLPGEPHPFRLDTIAQLSAFYPTYTALQREMQRTKTAQVDTTAGLVLLRANARIWVSHGYASIINATVRGTFNASVLNYYGLPVGAKGAPNMNGEADIISAASALAHGEAARVAAGGQPIAFPSVAEIMVHANAFEMENLEQGKRKMAYADAQKAVAAAYPEADRLILRLWNEIESAFDTGDRPSMRRKARNWGVVYVQGRKETPTAETNSVMGFVTQDTTGKALRGVRVRVAGSDVSTKTNARGRFALEVLAPGPYVLQFQLKGHVTQELPIEVAEGEMTLANCVLMEKPRTKAKENGTTSPR